MSKKLPKQAVNYRAARTRQRRCSTCVMFRPAPGTRKEAGGERTSSTGICTLVAGCIQANDVCDRWEAKPIS